VTVRRIVSGGQTGADRGALDAAIAMGIEHGGWCPLGRRAEDGQIPAHYQLQETDSRDYAERTRRNVRDSDATLVFTRGAPTGGSALTLEHARTLGKPVLHVDLATLDATSAAAKIRAWCETISVLNIAGSRESQSPGIAEAVRAVVELALAI
jgi:hypothetical protein